MNNSLLEVLLQVCYGSTLACNLSFQSSNSTSPQPSHTHRPATKYARFGTILERRARLLASPRQLCRLIDATALWKRSTVRLTEGTSPGRLVSAPVSAPSFPCLRCCFCCCCCCCFQGLPVVVAVAVGLDHQLGAGHLLLRAAAGGVPMAMRGGYLLLLPPPFLRPNRSRHCRVRCGDHRCWCCQKGGLQGTTYQHN